MKYKIRTALATGAAITTIALTLGQTAFAQDDAAIGAGIAAGLGNGQGYEQSTDHNGLETVLTFEQMQVKILEKFAQNENRLKEKLAKVDTLKVSDEIKDKMKERLNARLLEVGKTISQVQAASTKEALQQVRREGKKELRKSLREMAGKGRGLLKK
jgi:hypothetical protein